MKLYVAAGAIVGGGLEILRPEVLHQELARWKDCPVNVTIEEAVATRSLRANRYYWGVVVDHISDHTGFTPDETHHVLKQMFLPKKLALSRGNGELIEELVIGGSTTKLNTEEFFDYCARIKQWALEQLDVLIPEPDEY